MSQPPDYYRILGVTRKASKDEIRKAYHKLALQHHPDKSQASDAPDRFRAVNEAYEILRDQNKRDTYDRNFVLVKQSSKSGSDYKHSTSNSNYKYNHKPRYDDSFFRGSRTSDRARETYEPYDELERIRKIHSDLLDEANAKLRRDRRATDKGTGHQTSSKVFAGDILPDKDDDEFEKIVIDKLRSLAGRR